MGNYYIKSTTQKTYVWNGKVVPASVNPGNRWLILDESEYELFESTPVIRSLLRNNGILATDKEPSELRNDLSTVQANVVTLRAQNEALQKSLEDERQRYTDLENEAKSELIKLQQEVAALKAEAKKAEEE